MRQDGRLAVHRNDDPLPFEDRLGQARRAADFLFQVRGFDGFAREPGLDQFRAKKGGRGQGDPVDLGRIQAERRGGLGRRAVGKVDSLQHAAPERRKLGHRAMQRLRQFMPLSFSLGIGHAVVRDEILEPQHVVGLVELGSPQSLFARVRLEERSENAAQATLNRRSCGS